jgi:hypothetical protein
MRQVAHLSFADADAWAAAAREHFADVPGIHVVERGTEYDPTGETTEQDGMQVPVMAPRAGYRVDVLLDGVELPAALWPHLVNEEPRHQFMGYSTCIAPETAPDDGDTILVERPDGQPASAEAIATAEIAHVRRKLSAEEREDRRALHAATLAVIEQRAVRDRAAAERDAVNARLAALAAERDAQIAIRDKAVADLVGRVGAARTPFIAVRDAATARLREIADSITAEQAVRTQAVDATVAANAELVRLRAIAAQLR